MIHTIVVEIEDSIPPDTAEKLLTRAIARAFDDFRRMGDVKVIEYHHEKMTEATYAEGPDGEDYNDVYHTLSDADKRIERLEAENQRLSQANKDNDW